MDVREKLVEQLRWWSNECDRTNFGCQVRELLVAAANYIANGVTVQEWVSVTERMPKLIPCRAGTAYSEAVNVLTSDRKVITAIWDGTDWIGPFGFWDAEGEEITHWAPVLLPLQEPPKEGKA